MFLYYIKIPTNLTNVYFSFYQIMVFLIISRDLVPFHNLLTFFTRSIVNFDCLTNTRKKYLKFPISYKLKYNIL